jgi:iron(III) transport system permease protein
LHKPGPSQEGWARRQARPSLGLLFASSIAFLAASLPLFYLLRRAIGAEISEVSLILFRGKTLEILATTLGLTAAVTALSTLIGLALAWTLFNIDLPFRSALQALVILPVAIPSYVFTYSWISLIPGFKGFWAALFVLVLATTPYITLTTLAALRRSDWSTHEVAQTLGLNGLQIFIRVTWPQIKNSVAAGSLLSALYVLSDFGAISLLGVDTLTRAIENIYRGSFDRSSASILALILVAISALVIRLEERSRQRLQVIKSSSRIIKQVKSIDKFKVKLIAVLGIVAYLALGLVIPLFQLLAIFAANSTSINYPLLIKASLSTLIVACLGAVIALALALPVGVLSAQGSRFGRVSDKLILMVHALPGIVMGLALVSFGSTISWLYQSLLLLAFAYALLFMAKAVGSVRSSVDRVPKNLIEISQTLGLRKSATFRRVVVPLATPGLLSGTLLVLLAAMKELPATLMLKPIGFETLATQMWSYSSIFRFNEAAPYALLLVLVAAIPTFFINRPDKSDAIGGDEI